METQRLYYLDSHTAEFTARVLSCEAEKDGFAVVLDRTAFYPEGGGQPGDRGSLGVAAVTDTRERQGRIVHLCDTALTPGDEVTGRIDWQRRFRFMQLHSGEHMLSGLIHSRYGYDNVGFHMGKDTVTIDFSGMLDADALEELEAETNRLIWQDLPVEILWPDAEELAKLPYRSKKALSGEVRIVSFPGVDLCACCGTHVQRTGEIGLVKLLSCQKFHEGVRIEMLAGQQALEYLSGALQQNRQISGLLSAKLFETADAVRRLQQELSELKYRTAQLEDRLFAQKAEALTNAGDVLLFEEDLKPDGLRRLTDAVAAVCGGRCAVFSRTAEGYQYAVAHMGGDLRQFTRDMNTALNGRGGGKPHFVQGSVRADRQAIEAFFAS